jgi:hypothetical protein
MVWDTRRGLAACFMWKQVGLGFSSPASRLVEAQRRVVHVAPSRRLRRSQVEDERVDATGCVGPFYPNFTVFHVLGHRSSLVFSILLGLINRILDGWVSLPLFHISLGFLRVGLMCYEAF